MCNVVQIIVCPFVLFLLVIVLSVLLRLAASNYLLSIFKLFYTANNWTSLVEITDI